MSMNDIERLRLKRKVMLTLLNDHIGQKAKQIKTRYGNKRPNYKESAWGRLLRRNECSNVNHKDGRYFRRRFRVPYELFLRIVQICREYKWFPESHRSAPLELKVLATLRKLGRGGCFDSLAELTLIDQETLRVFYHRFCKLFSENVFHTYVRGPETPAEIEKVVNVYARLGFPGAIGSVDCTHIRWDKCPAHLRAVCKGKEGFTSLGFEITVDHFRRIHAVTGSHYGTRNDKTIVQFDDHIQSIHKGEKYADVEYKLYDADGELQTCTGAWIISDNGYHRWSCMACPMKHTINPAEAIWSCTLESVRKDVECTIGIMKQRFRELKNPVELHHQSDIDNMFWTCCILHNLLIEYDGLDRLWEEDPDAEPDEENDLMTLQEERAAARVGGDVDMTLATVPTATVLPLLAEEVEEELNFFSLRSNLITHFTVAKQKGEVHWLTN
jgi:hypothetical protein